jgi:hypothetical protein
MRKRPTIKGRGADIYLGDNSAQPTEQKPKRLKRSAIGETLPALNGLHAAKAEVESSCPLNAFKKAVAWQIETAEAIANQTIEHQERRAQWAQDVFLAPWLAAQASLARKIVNQSAATARTLWRI